MMGGGFLIGISGHVFKSKTMVIAGIGLIFLAQRCSWSPIGSYG